MTMPKEEENHLSHKDVQVYARNLVAVTIDDYLKYRWFDRDLLFFNEQDQERIKKQLRTIVRQMNEIAGSTLPPQKVGRPKKGQEESA